MSVASKALTVTVTVAAEVLCGQSPASRKSLLNAARTVGKTGAAQEATATTVGRTTSAELCAPGEARIKVNTQVTAKIAETPGAKQLTLPSKFPVPKLSDGKVGSPLGWKKPLADDKLRFLIEKLATSQTGLVANAKYPNLFVDMKKTPWGRRIEIPGGLWTTLVLEPASNVIKSLAKLSQPADLVNPAALFEMVISMLKHQSPSTRQKAAELVKEGARVNLKIEEVLNAPGAKQFILEQTHHSGEFARPSFRASMLIAPIDGQLHVGACYPRVIRAGGPAADTARKAAVLLSNEATKSAAPCLPRTTLSIDDFHLNYLGNHVYLEEQRTAFRPLATRVPKGNTVVVERNHAVAGLLLVMQGLNKELAGAQMSRFSTKQAARKVHNKGGARDRQHSGKKGAAHSNAVDPSAKLTHEVTVWINQSVRHQAKGC